MFFYFWALVRLGLSSCDESETLLTKHQTILPMSCTRAGASALVNSEPDADYDADRVRRNAAAAHMPAELANVVAKYAPLDWYDIATPMLDFILEYNIHRI
jgi:hypothetical protein